MPVEHVLIANRGEIAVRIARAAAELGVRATMVYAQDDADSLHCRWGDRAVPIAAAGPAAYLDIAQLIEIARESGCDSVHPGCGFLSESAAFARACGNAGLLFVGPDAQTLEVMGDKARARAMACECGIPVLPGSNHAVTVPQARLFFESLGPGESMVVKALAGGGGRGMRIVSNAAEIEEAMQRCASEASAAFGDAALLVEQFLPQARHIEVQILGDGERVAHLWDRDCSLQRRGQKLVEIAPPPFVHPGTRAAMLRVAVLLGEKLGYRGVGTVEFLVSAAQGQEHFHFIEVNPRLQVEHTITEEVTGIDLVHTQIALASGKSLVALGLDVPERHVPRGYALQLRVNAETLTADGNVMPGGGVLHRYTPPSGPGVRVDSCGYDGYRINSRYDSLLAKLIVHSPAGFAAVLARARRALGEFRIEGAVLNLSLLAALLRRAEIEDGRFCTRFIDRHVRELVESAGEESRSQPGAQLRAAELRSGESTAAADSKGIRAAMHGRVVSVGAAAGTAIRGGEVIAVLEAMKMEFAVAAPCSGTVIAVHVSPGDVVAEGQLLVSVAVDGTAVEHTQDAEVHQDLDAIRPDLAAVLARRATTLDENRPQAVARRRRRGQRTARENIADLCDPGSFIEYGRLALAGQRQRRSEDELLQLSPADGLITGVGSVGAAEFGELRTRTAIMAYDATVFAGTQGTMNHLKADRLVELAAQWRMPFVLFAEGGGGRPGETDRPKVAALDTPTFRDFARLSALVPSIGIVAGRCFAGNAALLGCCDVIVAARNSNIGMGGPAMIEGAGLGSVAPEQIGPIDVQTGNGVVDIEVADEEAGVRAAKKCLAYFQGQLARWDAADQRVLRHLVPPDRRRPYAVRDIIAALFDTDGVLELKQGFGAGILTALARIEGRPVGVMANNPHCLGGAIDAPAAGKAAQFVELCGARSLPLVSLCDTPGFMVGPEAEKTGLVRHVARLFKAVAQLRSPMFCIALRKGYGLGAQAMMGGCSRAPFFNVSWPTGEFGGMGLEGAVRLGYKRELEAIADPEARRRDYDSRVALLYEKGQAVNMAAFLEIDEVIDPAETRGWLVRGLSAASCR